MTEIKLKNYTLTTAPDDIFIIPEPNAYYCSNYRTSKGFDYIHKIVMLTRKRPEAINILKEYLEVYPAKINCQNDEGWTPLHISCRNSRTSSTEETVALLLGHSGININIQDYCGKTALHYACQHSNTNVVRKFLEYSNMLNVEN